MWAQLHTARGGSELTTCRAAWLLSTTDQAALTLPPPLHLRSTVEHPSTDTGQLPPARESCHFDVDAPLASCCQLHMRQGGQRGTSA